TPEVNINISVDEPVRDVEGILAVCESHFEANRLTLPKDRNALECYEQVLAIDPGNREAVKGLDTIESKYQDWLALAMTERDQEKTDRYRKILQKLNPDSPFVQQLEKVQVEAERNDELDEARKRQERKNQKAGALVESKVQQGNKLTKQQMPEQEQDGKETPKAEQLAKANMPGARPDPDSPYNGTWEGTMHCSPTQSGSSKAFSKWVLLKINGDRVFLTGDHAMGDGTQEGSISFKGGLFSKPGKIRIAGKEKHMDGWLLDYRYAGYHGEEIVLKGKRGSRSCKIKLARTTGSSS
ncbi:MAG: hypothetical protein QNI91_13520, partial [Arenicellales bacterium]|nr:hypothetical protein [Arenicellales bacterium]